MWIRRGENAAADVAETTDGQEPAGFHVPEELRPYYDQTSGLTAQQLARIELDGGTVSRRLIHTRLPGQSLGRPEGLRPPEILTLAEYEHEVRLEQADELRRNADNRAAARARDEAQRCPVCATVDYGTGPGALCMDCAHLAQVIRDQELLASDRATAVREYLRKHNA